MKLFPLLYRNTRLFSVLLLAGLLLAAGCSPTNQEDLTAGEYVQPAEAEAENTSPDIPEEPPLTEYVPRESFEEDEVPYPRLEAAVQSRGGYYYISVDPTLAADIDTALAAGVTAELERREDALGYTPDVLCPQIAYAAGPEASSWRLLAQNSAGEFLLDNVMISQETGEAIIDRTENATGWELTSDGRLDNPLQKFDGITEISIWWGSDCLQVISDKDRITAFERFMQEDLLPTCLPKTPEHIIELCCQLENGKSVSAVVSPSSEYLDLWLPPCYYYSTTEDAGPLFGALGLEGWPSPIPEIYEEGMFPQEVLSQLYDRVSGEGEVLP